MFEFFESAWWNKCRCDGITASASFISVILAISPGIFSILGVAGGEMCQRLSFFLLHQERFYLLGQGTNLRVVPISKNVYSNYTSGTGEKSLPLSHGTSVHILNWICTRTPFITWHPCVPTLTGGLWRWFVFLGINDSLLLCVAILRMFGYSPFFSV